MTHQTVDGADDEPRQPKRSAAEIAYCAELAARPRAEITVTLTVFADQPLDEDALWDDLRDLLVGREVGGCEVEELTYSLGPEHDLAGMQALLDRFKR